MPHSQAFQVLVPACSIWAPKMHFYVSTSGSCPGSHRHKCLGLATSSQHVPVRGGPAHTFSLRPLPTQAPASDTPAPCQCPSLPAGPPPWPTHHGQLLGTLSRQASPTQRPFYSHLNRTHTRRTAAARRWRLPTLCTANLDTCIGNGDISCTVTASSLPCALKAALGPSCPLHSPACRPLKCLTWTTWAEVTMPPLLIHYHCQSGKGFLVKPILQMWSLRLRS